MRTGWAQSLAVARPAAAHAPAAIADPRRKLQLALGAVWLLDAMLQFQPVMFGKGFGQMLAGGAQGNPAIVARPVTWSATFIDHHAAVLNAIFAAIQLLLGLGIAFRPTVVDTDAGHVLMGLAMAGMLAARLRILPAALEAVFAAGAAWFAWQLFQSRRRAPASSWRCPHPAPHLVECIAMLYMLLALPSSLAARSAAAGTAAGMAAMSASAPASRFSFLALLLALYMFGYVVRVADRLTVCAPVLAVPPASPALTAALVPADAPSPAARTTTSTGPVRLFLAPTCAALCKIAMGLTMGYMLVVML